MVPEFQPHTTWYKFVKTVPFNDESLLQAEQEEKLKARRERFGLSTTANTKPVSNKSLEEKKQLRAERFKIV